MSNRIAVIVEGESYERGIIKNLQKYVMEPMGASVTKIITLSAGMNIYMLWKKIKEDEDVDIIEVLRESSDAVASQIAGFQRDEFGEIYLFFDFDAHQNNLAHKEDAGDVLSAMLRTFDNETENGKLYVSYPMAEAIRDYHEGSCEAFSGSCSIAYNVSNYKRISGTNNPKAAVTHYRKRDWQEVILCYTKRVSRLSHSACSLADCKKQTPQSIYKRQKDEMDFSERIIILSAFPEYLIDYFRIELLEDYLEGRSFTCSRKCYEGQATKIQTYSA